MKALALVGTIITLSLFNTAVAQTDSVTTGAITGRITDVNKAPVNGATIYINRRADSSLVKVALSNETGDFAFNSLKPDTLVLTVTHVGYLKYVSTPIVLTASGSIRLPEIQLIRNDGNTLTEVVVTERKKFIERKIDRTIVNVGAYVSNIGTNAIEVLEKAPGVNIDNFGGINLLGKGVTVFVDGRSTYLSSTDLINYLRSLPSDMLDKIELMPIPPSKYDAAGAGGVINIITKKNRRRGFNGNVNGSYGQGVYDKTNGNLWLNYRNRKMNLFGNYGFGAPKDFNQLDENRIYKDAFNNPVASIDQHSFTKEIRTNNNLKLGFDYFATKRTTLGMVFNGFYNKFDAIGRNTASIFNRYEVLDSTVISDNNSKEKFRNGSVNLNLVHQFDSMGGELAVDLDYITYHSNNDQRFENMSYSTAGIPQSTEVLLGFLPRTIDIYSVKADYARPMKKEMRLEFGWKSSLVKTNNRAEYFNGAMQPDYEKTNTFFYNENINAVYGTVSREYKRFGIKLGVRMEHTNSEGHQLGNVVKPDSSFSRNYVNAFPSVFLSWKPDSTGKHQFYLNYNKRIDRPSYDQLNPFLRVAQKYYFLAGNPFLQPQMSTNVQFTWQFRDRLNMNLYYGYLGRAFNNIVTVVDDKYYNRPGNVGSVSLWGVFAYTNANFTKWWYFDASTNPELVHIKSVYNDKHVDTVFMTTSLNFTNRFSLKKSWTIELFSNWGSRSFTGQYAYKNRYGLGLGVRKEFWNNTASISLNARDIFFTGINRGRILNVSQTEAQFRNPTDSRVVMLSFSYRFGRDAFERRRWERNAAMDEQIRVR